MNSSPRFRLFLMMVLEIAIWGAWLPLIFGYLPSLGFSATEPPQAIAAFVPSFLTWLFSEQGMILNAFPVAAVIGMFFSNQFADRNFAAERFLSFSHLIGGLAILGCGFTKSFWPFFWLMFVHCLLYVPTLSITNSIAFANMKDPQKEFGIIRMGGTVGWIAAAWPFTFILVDWAKVDAMHPQGMVAWFGAVFASGLKGEAFQAATRWTYIVSGAISLALALFSLTLPHTPPKRKEEGAAESLAWLEAVRLLKHPFVLVLWIVTFIDSFVHNCYFNWTGTFLGTDPAHGGVGIASNWIMPVMTIGQVAELITMLVLGVTLKKLGWRWTMILGIMGHAARFAVYAFFPKSPGLIIAVQLLHGICYAFFFATVYIFVDAYFPKDVRASAQGLFNVMILGIGALVANSICPRLIQQTFAHDGLVDFRHLFLVPCYAGIFAMLLLLIAFHPPKNVEATGGPGSAPH
ncbi:MAG: MFS transporter [Chthoniobacter sp.]|uniref:MFS transporter n=1 Tax=Chthoniobacter sp. TaxID=2510640 RepID=UPI0032AA7E6F